MLARLLVHVERAAADPVATKVADKHELGDAERLPVAAIKAAIAATAGGHLQDTAGASADRLGDAEVRGGRVHERREDADAGLRVVAAPVAAVQGGDRWRRHGHGGGYEGRGTLGRRASLGGGC